MPSHPEGPRYRDELFPTLHFRQAYDVLCQRTPQRASQHYLRLLQLAAGTTESEVDLALALVLESGAVPTSDTVTDLVRGPRTLQMPELSSASLDLSLYDQLLVQEQAV